MKRIKRPLSMLLVMLMVVSLFAVVPATASAAEDSNATGAGVYYGTDEDFQAADAATALINALPGAVSITADDQEAVAAAKAAYDALTDAQKQLVPINAKVKLSACQITLAAAVKAAEDEAAAAAVTEQIQALPSAAKVSVKDKESIEAASAAYNALTDDQKKLISLKNKLKLTAVKGALDAALKAFADDTAAADVEAMIGALPAAADVTLADKDAIDEAKAAYDALSDAQKKLVNLTDEAKLAAAAAALKQLEDEAASDAVEDMIAALPASNAVTIDDKAAVEEAKAAYDALTGDQKKMVTLVNRIKLANVQAALAKIEADIAAAEAVAAQIDALPAAQDVTFGDAADIMAAKSAYDALTDAQKALVDEATMQKLTDAETALSGAAEAETVKLLIHALPNPEEVTIKDKALIEEARAAYDQLDDAQKAMLSDETVQLLTDDEAALAQVEADIEAAQNVAVLIHALPAATAVTLKDKAVVDEAAAAYGALTDAQKAYVSLKDKAKLTLVKGALDAAVKASEDEAAADVVEDLIAALPASADVTLDDRDAIEEAKAAYDALSGDQKKLVTLVNRIKLLNDLAAVNKIENDIEMAEAITEQINALPAAEDVTLDNVAEIKTARARYDALTDDQKALVDEATVQKLTDAEAALDDAASAKAVSMIINALPYAEDVTLADKAVIEAARADYDALTDAQKAQIDAETLQVLLDDEAALEHAEADAAVAKAVEAQIEALPAATKVTVNDKDAIEAAAAAYDALTDAQKAYVSPLALAKLTLDKGALDAALKFAADEAAADAVEELIAKLPASADVTLADKAAIEEAKAAYDALSGDQKKLVNLVDRVKLLNDLAAVNKIENDIAEAAAVTEAINALPAPENVTVDDFADIKTARALYNALTDAQKAYVDAETCKKLTDDEAALDDALAADTVKTMIDALPAADEVTANDKDFIEATRVAYDELTDAQKALIDEDTYKKLTDAEDALALVEADMAAAQAVAEQIEALPAPLAVTVNDKDAIEQAAAAYDALTDAQKAYVPAVDKAKLALDQAALAAAEKAAEDEAVADVVEDMIYALPAPDAVTLDDKAAIEEAKAAYDALTNDQKKYVTLVNRIKLALDQVAVAKIENDIAAAEAVKEMIDALPAAEDVTADDKDDIEAARAAYDALTDDQKALIDEDTYKKLTDAEDALAKAEEDAAAAEAVKEMIDALPAAEDVTADDKDDIEAARAAYDALTDDQKALIDEDTYKKLTDAEDSLQPSILLGDADGDSTVSISDVTVIQRYLAELLVLDDTAMAAADVNGDGNVTVDDATILQRYLAEMPVDYPIGQMV